MVTGTEVASVPFEIVTVNRYTGVVSKFRLDALATVILPVTELIVNVPLSLPAVILKLSDPDPLAGIVPTSVAFGLASEMVNSCGPLVGGSITSVIFTVIWKVSDSPFVLMAFACIMICCLIS